MTAITNPLDDKQRTVKSKEHVYSLIYDPVMPTQEISVDEIAKKQKHEEIKRMALALYTVKVKDVNTAHAAFEEDESLLFKSCFNECWQAAEYFYKFAKEKEHVDNKTHGTFKEWNVERLKHGTFKAAGG